jgi:hypothetical protein
MVRAVPPDQARRIFRAADRTADFGFVGGLMARDLRALIELAGLARPDGEARAVLPSDVADDP